MVGGTSAVPISTFDAGGIDSKRCIRMQRIFVFGTTTTLHVVGQMQQGTDANRLNIAGIRSKKS